LHGDDAAPWAPRLSPGLEKRPGANRDTASIHHPAYDFNDAPIPYGVSLWAKVMKAGMPVR
jgi:hypothetical protein